MIGPLHSNIHLTFSILLTFLSQILLSLNKWFIFWDWDILYNYFQNLKTCSSTYCKAPFPLSGSPSGNECFWIDGHFLRLQLRRNLDSCFSLIMMVKSVVFDWFRHSLGFETSIQSPYSLYYWYLICLFSKPNRTTGRKPRVNGNYSCGYKTIWGWKLIYSDDFMLKPFPSNFD